LSLFPKIDIPAIRAELQAKFDLIVARLDEIIAELRKANNRA